MFDLDAYLRRVGASECPCLAELHRAHATSIPFENLDPYGGTPVSLAIEDLQHKLVGERRGGYCFEHNLLLKAALEALGAEVEPLLARVRVGAPPGAVRPRSHLLLRVRHEGATWHADVGFGAGTLLEPLPFGPGETHEQSGWRFRVVEEGAELVLQTVGEEGWKDLYAFLPQPVPIVDIEMSNWFTSSHPASVFVTSLMIVAQHPDGTRMVLSDRDELALTERTPSGETVTALAREQIPSLLAERFGLPGYTLDGGGRVVRAQSTGPATSV
ncbi:MAG TPA: arylamine N-acetyltransferase [Solirubrobacteraceae bacterium]|nr:arylamine N-acetyltransferase [Solirubrobacteraceae bacterium]